MGDNERKITVAILTAVVFAFFAFIAIKWAWGGQDVDSRKAEFTDWIEPDKWLLITNAEGATHAVKKASITAIIESYDESSTTIYLGGQKLIYQESFQDVTKRLTQLTWKDIEESKQ